MPWPKGKPRKGYIKKDGTPHAAKGKGSVKADPAVVVKPRKVKVVEDVEIVHSHPELWGMKGNGAITEPCPNCMYAYADGGYCGECGWMQPIRVDEYGTHTGRRL